MRSGSSTEDLAHRLAVARGDQPADLVIKGGRALSMFTGELLEVDVAVAGEHVAGVGPGYEGTEVFDASGLILLPGFIDGHMHIESTKLMVDEFARAVLPWGTTTVVIDPHEIANVFGLEGVRALLTAADRVPLDLYVMVSSCVPASAFESNGATVEAEDITAFLAEEPRAIGVAEMMNFPDVVAGDPASLAKVQAARRAGKLHLDGHAPGLSGKGLSAYLAAGVRSDHECTTYEEALEKRRLGMWIMIREGSAARNLEDFRPTAVWKRGRMVAEEGRAVDIPKVAAPDWMRGSVRLPTLTADDFVIRVGGRVRVIGVDAGQIVTRALVTEPARRDGQAVADPARDLAKISVIERHRETGRMGVGFVSGFGLQRGALASTHAHDAHNVMVVGVDDADMAAAVNRLAEIGGGQVAVAGEQVLAEVPCPIGGLMSDRPAEEVAGAVERMEAASHELGARIAAPFMTMSFMALSVIPELKITDRGLVDTVRFELVPLEA